MIILLYDSQKLGKSIDAFEIKPISRISAVHLLIDVSKL